jgi:hypothetical protein
MPRIARSGREEAVHQEEKAPAVLKASLLEIARPVGHGHMQFLAVKNIDGREDE